VRLLLGALALLVASPAAAVASGMIRVALVESARMAEIRGFDIDVTPLGVGCPRCPGVPWRVDVVRATATATAVEIDGRAAAAFRLTSERSLRLNGREYVAPLEIIRNGSGLAVINELPMEEYVAGVLRAETGERWPAEALRAQAIVARTYAAYQRSVAGGKPYQIVATTAHQLFAGRVSPTSPSWNAVQDTAGQVLRWEGELFPAFYHSESGGYTEDPRTVFAARNIPALKPVVCPFSTGSPHYYWSLDVRLGELTDILRKGGVDVGLVSAIEVTERTPSLRASVVTVRGTRGAVRVRGNDLRRMVGFETLKSTLFAVAIDGEAAHFAGRGYGHGVGLCQWGAKGMAEQGHPARRILEFYYPGATLGFLDGG